MKLSLKPAVIFLLSMLTLVASSQADVLTEKIKSVEKKLGARIGVAVYDTQSKALWSYKGDTRFPLMSTFKTLACAKLLADAESGIVDINSTTMIDADSLITWSPVTEKRVGETMSLKQACTATMVMSDNTAANIVLAGIDGPSGLTKFMRAIGDDVTRLDRIEPYLGEAIDGDPRDSSTPNAMVASLNRLLFAGVLSTEGKVQLKQWMMDNKVSDALLRSVLPQGWSIADRSGAGGYGSRGITAVVWSEQRPALIISIYLTQTTASFAQRNDTIATIGKHIFTVYQ
ncbi:class A beta-lactamase [Psychromonas sp. Urea-02u-13]|uniref:class A beta-lactamase n=1 Tax=Psychromonas sp. Urea-02u-13 TaxID=2058326 RepID=UPI000C31D1C7|nr:class A beta-lactamase [Psychromonas sp. Urea-02u-13]